jgi:hypothetical protein
MAERQRAALRNSQQPALEHRIKHEQPQNLSPRPAVATPYEPQLDEHVDMLSRIPFSAQRREFILRLHQTYGNRYVQRLMDSLRVQAKPTLGEPGGVYGQNPIQRKVNSIQGISDGDDITVVNKDRGMEIDLPDAVIEFDGQSTRPKSAVKRQAKALWTRRDMFAKNHPLVYYASDGQGINSHTKPTQQAMTMADAQWQDDGPTEKNIKQKDNTLTVHDAPGFPWFYPEMSPGSFQAEFTIEAKDPVDADTKSIRYTTTIANESKP